MIKSFSAFTHEVDDADAAAAEIIKQLDLNGKNHLMKHTIGIVSCFADYIDSGVWTAVAEALPFELWGITTIASASTGIIGETMLSILVLTSDDVSFSAALSEPIMEASEEPFKVLYEKALSKLPGKPSLMLTFSPLFSKLSINFYVACMSKISGGVPNFGAVAMDHNHDYHEAYVLSNGKYSKNQFAVLLMHGDVSPSFHVGTISDEKVFPEKGIVTAAQGNILQMVNGKPALEYLLSLGLTQGDDGQILGINSFPIIVDHNDGTMPVIQAMLAITPEGHVVCGENVLEGSTLSIGAFNPDEIVATSGPTLKKALAAANHHTVLVYSCISRYFALGYDSLKELEQLRKQMADTDINYIAAYAGGEICPIDSGEGNIVNRSHSNSFIICTF